MTATAAVATQVADPSRKPDLLAMFDIAGGHERVEARLRNALDGNGAAGADLEILERKASAQAIRVVAEADTSWSYGSRSFAGRAKGSVEYVSPGALKQVMKQRCEEWSKSKPVMDLLRSKLASDPKAGMLLPAEFPLGAVPHTVGCEEPCTQCGGTRTHDCHICRNGRVSCYHCGGLGELHVTGQQYRARCPTCRGSRTVGCQGCGAAGWVCCAPCRATGIITTLCEGTVSAKVVYRTEPHDGFDPAWHAALTRNGHAWLLDICKAGNAPRLAEAPGGIAAQWSIAVQVLTQRFRILGKAYEAVFVGNKETVWSMPRFLDAAAKPIADAISRATPVEAFAIADRHPLSKDVRRVVLNGGEDGQVVGQFETAASPEFVQGMRLSLQRARDTIASHAIKAAWRRAIPVSLLLVGYGVATGLFGRLLPSPRGSGGATTGDLNLFAGLVVFCALLGASYWLAGNAGRNALKVALGTPVKAMPPQGKAPAIAALVGILLYAGIAYFVGRSSPDAGVAPVVSAPPHASASAKPVAAAVPSASDLYDRSFPKVAPPTVPFSGR